MLEGYGTKEGWQRWAAERDESLRDPYGWLSLVELEWLDQTPRKLSSFPGTWSAQGNTVTAEFGAEEPKVYRDGQQVESPLTIEVAKGQSDRSLRDESGREIEVIYRFWGPCVRVRDPQASRLENYQGLDRYDFDPAWVLRGRLLPYDQVRQVEVEAAVEGGSHILPTWADAELALPGDEDTVTLVVSGEGPEGDPRVLFFDEGMTQWRAVSVAIDGGTVVADLNRATLFPAHLSPFGTCPKPPEGNRIPRVVEAGEKPFEGRESL